MTDTLRSLEELGDMRPLHRQLGITPYVHRQAVLHDPGPGVMAGRNRNFSYDYKNRVWASDHLYRASVTLAGW